MPALQVYAFSFVPHSSRGSRTHPIKTPVLCLNSQPSSSALTPWSNQNPIKPPILHCRPAVTAALSCRGSPGRLHVLINDVVKRCAFRPEVFCFSNGLLFTTLLACMYPRARLPHSGAKRQTTGWLLKPRSALRRYRAGGISNHCGGSGTIGTGLPDSSRQNGE